MHHSLRYPEYPGHSGQSVKDVSPTAKVYNVKWQGDSKL
jgi:hypothetical protein